MPQCPGQQAPGINDVTPTPAAPPLESARCACSQQQTTHFFCSSTPNHQASTSHGTEGCRSHDACSLRLYSCRGEGSEGTPRAMLPMTYPSAQNWDSSPPPGVLPKNTSPVVISKCGKQPHNSGHLRCRTGEGVLKQQALQTGAQPAMLGLKCKRGLLGLRAWQG
jgi:hypothetical protein